MKVKAKNEVREKANTLYIFAHCNTNHTERDVLGKWGNKNNKDRRDINYYKNKYNKIAPKATREEARKLADRIADRMLP